MKRVAGVSDEAEAVGQQVQEAADSSGQDTRRLRDEVDRYLASYARYSSSCKRSYSWRASQQDPHLPQPDCDDVSGFTVS